MFAICTAISLVFMMFNSVRSMRAFLQGLLFLLGFVVYNNQFGSAEGLM